MVEKKGMEDSMPATIDKKTIVSLNEHIAEYVRADTEFMEGIRKGAKDCRAGRVHLWAEVKKELNIR